MTHTSKFGFLLCFPDDGRADFDNSLVVSMEINGIMYQGVLFAQAAGTAHSQRRI